MRNHLHFLHRKMCLCFSLCSLSISQKVAACIIEYIKHPNSHVSFCLCFISILQCHHTHTHTHTHRAAVALNGREDLTQAERPHVFICVITAVSSSLCPSLRLYSSPSLSPSSLSSLPLSTVWTRLFFFFRPFHPHHHTLTFLSTLHSFILSRCYQWPVASSNQTAASAPRGSVCLAGKLSVCVSF